MKREWRALAFERSRCRSTALVSAANIKKKSRATRARGLKPRKRHLCMYAGGADGASAGEAASSGSPGSLSEEAGQAAVRGDEAKKLLTWLDSGCLVFSAETIASV